MKKDERISLEHGAGGATMASFIMKEILPLFIRDMGEISLEHLDDSAVIDDIVFTIDSHTVKPIIFPGGDLGSLSICGTINDLLAIGAVPRSLGLAIVMPEGFELSRLKKILDSASKISKDSDVAIIAGDTKVVGRDDIDEPIITTAGIGRRHSSMDGNLERAGGRKTRWLSDNNLNPGDKIILTGSVGDHGITILSEREGYGFGGDISSDVCALVDVMDAALAQGGVASAKDPTRGGIANVLNEFASKSDVGIKIYESKIPIKDWVASAGEMLGIDPLSVGNEGKMVLAVHPSRAQSVLEAIKGTEDGKDAVIIGEVIGDMKGVILKTVVGGTRILELPIGDPVPRIC